MYKKESLNIINLSPQFSSGSSKHRNYALISAAVPIPVPVPNLYLAASCYAHLPASLNGTSAVRIGKARRYIKILEVWMVTRWKLHTEEPQIFGATTQNFDARATRRMWFVQPRSTYHLYMKQGCSTIMNHSTKQHKITTKANYTWRCRASEKRHRT